MSHHGTKNFHPAIKVIGEFPHLQHFLFFFSNSTRPYLNHPKPLPEFLLLLNESADKWVENQLYRPITSTGVSCGIYAYMWRFGSNFWNDGDRPTGLQIQPPSSIVNLNVRGKQRKPESFISLKHAATKLEHFCWVVYFLTELLMEINWEDCENACQSRKISNNTSENALL